MYAKRESLVVLTDCNMNPLPAAAMHSYTIKTTGVVDGDIVERSAEPRIDSALPIKTNCSKRPVFWTAERVSVTASDRLLCVNCEKNGEEHTQKSCQNQETNKCWSGRHHP